jgi:hypothetical protein
MKKVTAKNFSVIIGLLLFGMLFVNGCEPFRQIEPSPTPIPPGQHGNQNNFVITYNYGNTGKVQLSANNIILKTGQKLILQPAPGLTGSIRFLSSGEYFFGDIMQQETGQETEKVIFTAIKPGKGKLQIIPNGTETNRATDLWVTVQ